jgi:YbbR domain-containing protein
MGYNINKARGEVSFNIPIEYYSIPQNLTLSGESPKEINVRFRGSQKLLSSLNQDHLRVQIGLSKAHPGTNPISFSVRNIDVPSGITITGFSPRKITLQLSQASRDDKK